MQVGPDIVITIAANKCDLEKERSVPDAVVAAFAQQVKMLSYICWAVSLLRHLYDTVCGGVGGGWWGGGVLSYSPEVYLTFLLSG